MEPSPCLKLKEALETPPDPEYLTLESWANRLEKLPTLYNKVTQNLAYANRKQAKYFNRNRREVTFNEGDPEDSMVLSSVWGFAKGPTHSISPVVGAKGPNTKNKSDYGRRVMNRYVAVRIR